jgi:signal transduction histidine kinase/ligand-binding sensor domain-containing protein
MRRIVWRMFISMLATGIVAPAPAATPDASSPWIVRNWRSDDGLPNNNVTGLAQSSDGYLWIAAGGRLARFDGVQFDSYLPAKIVPQFDRKITALLNSPKSGLWLGMDRGPVLCFNAGVVHLITNGVPELTADSMVEDADGVIWILYNGGTGGVLSRIKDGRTSRVFTGGGESRSIVCDRSGQAWLSTGGQVGAMRHGEFVVFTTVANRPTRLAPARAGGVWICCGLQLYYCNESGNLKTLETFHPEHAGASATAMLEDRNGAVWIGTSDSGLFRYANDHFESISTSHREVRALLEDREGDIWAGTGGGGLDRIQPRAIELEGTESGLPFEVVQSLCEDPDGVVWAATQNGLLARRGARGWQVVSTNADWPGGLASCVAADSSGSIWIGTLSRKLISFQGGRFKAWGAREGIVNRNIHCLLASRNGDVWIGGNAPDTLQRLRDGKLTTMPLPRDVRVMRAMVEDAAGSIWIGTSKGLLLRINGDGLVDETARTTGTPLSIRSLSTTPDGSLWIGYAGWGLGRLKDGKFARITAEQGLYDDHISEVLADENGWLWLGTDAGIFKIRQQEFEQVAAGRVDRVHCVRYGPDDGMASLQANVVASPGALRSRDGRLWLPTRTALAVINPERIRPDAEIPAVMLKRVLVDDRLAAAYPGPITLPGVLDLQNPSASLRLPPGHRRLEFEFTALSFAAPDNLGFQHRLDGFDDDWVDGGSVRTVNYSRLPAGTYRFRVKACNRDGIWNEAGATLAFIVQPFVWQTWWFRLAAFAAFTSGIVALARYLSFRRLRLRLQLVEQQAALDKERTRIARDIHDDLGCRLTEIVLLTEVLQNPGQAKVAPEQIQQISTAARQGLQSLDETVWAINPRNDTVAHLIDYLGQFAVEFLQAANIRCHADLPEHPPAQTLSAEVRHNLFLGVKEALNNVVRHSRASEATLAITIDTAGLRVRIQDNGRGFAQAPDDAYADGLRNMRQRMEEIGARFEVESQPGSGTRICFLVPWRPESISPLMNAP